MWDIVMTILICVSIAAIAFLIWVFVELALTVRKTLKVVSLA